MAAAGKLCLRTGEFNLAVSSTGQVFANVEFRKNDLTLLPFGTVSLVPKEKVSKSSVILQYARWKEDEQLVVNHTKCNFEKSTGCWCPFFWRKESKDEKDEKPNMAKAVLKYEDLTIPCSRNNQKLTKGTALYLEPTEESKKSKKK